MRISTQTIFQAGSARIGELQSGMAKTQMQVASGRRILSPSDDPLAAARALDVSQSRAVNAQYSTNRDQAMNFLGSVEGSLTSVTSLMQSIKDSIIAAGNPTLNDSDRSFIAADLRGRFADMLALANSRDALGDYMFAGFQTNAPAFVETAPGVVAYQGDQGQRMIQVDTSRQVAVTASGDSIFQNGSVDVFQTISDLIAVLETPGTATLKAGLDTANLNMTAALDNVLSTRASIGSNMQAIDFFEVSGQDRDIQYSGILSDLQDLDYADALSRLSQQQTMLEAAQKSFVTTTGLSLFNFI